MASSSSTGETYAGSSAGPRSRTYDQYRRTASAGVSASTGRSTPTSQDRTGAAGPAAAISPSNTSEASGPARRPSAGSGASNSRRRYRTDPSRVTVPSPKTIAGSVAATS